MPELREKIMLDVLTQLPQLFGRMVALSQISREWNTRDFWLNAFEEAFKVRAEIVFEKFEFLDIPLGTHADAKQAFSKTCNNFRDLATNPLQGALVYSRLHDASSSGARKRREWQTKASAKELWHLHALLQHLNDNVYNEEVQLYDPLPDRVQNISARMNECNYEEVAGTTFSDYVHPEWGPMRDWDTSKLRTLHKFFVNGNIDLTKTDLSAWDTSQCTKMRFTFAKWHNHPETTPHQLRIEAWDVARVEDMDNAFYNNPNVLCTLDDWNVSSLRTASSMFQGSVNFTSDLSRWKVGNLENAPAMFMSAGLFQSDLSRWNVSKLKNAEGMFRSATSFKSDLSEWDVSNLESAHSMFMNATSFKSDLSMWDVSNLKYAERMFNNATLFESNLERWDVRKLLYLVNMFSGCKDFKSHLEWWDLRNAKAFSTSLFGSERLNKTIEWRLFSGREWWLMNAGEMSTALNELRAEVRIETEKWRAERQKLGAEQVPPLEPLGPMIEVLKKRSPQLASKLMELT